MASRLAILSGVPMSGADDAMRDASFGRIGSCRDVAEEGRRVRFHRRQFASHDAAAP